ncbi:MAG TPA: ATP-binding protein [Candidatus Blautia merdigallinarum]|uniref:ATP-binding protein n=1 Tax=Candidatus Blautia merdigallinarum TaxID=2838495 RepID=A0A9D2N608_9FIRM|nr:ATP-binding protein [Candidatus Blautia merdigallinarum]
MEDSYIKKMNMKENICMELMQKADEEYIKNNHQHTKQECAYLQQAATLRSELASMSIGEERAYQQRKLNELNRKITKVIMEVDPEFMKRYKENKQKEKHLKNGSGAGKADTGGKEKPLDESIASWFKEAPKHSFADVSGMHELKEQLKECIANAQLKNLEDYLKMKKLHSYFFIGPPGCGKTYIIEAFAHELMDKNYTYLSLAGSDILSRYVGEAEKIVTRLFEEAENHTPCIIFIDEIDGVCKNRSLPNLPEYAASITTAFLTGYNRINSSDKDIIFIGATNYPNQVDDAMLDRVELVRVPFPDLDARKRAFSHSLKEIISLEEDFSYDEMAEKTEKYNYRDIDRMVSRIKKEILKQVIHQYPGEQNAIEALKAGKFLLTREMFDKIQEDFLPTPKDEIEKELDEWERRFKKGIE